MSVTIFSIIPINDSFVPKSSTIQLLLTVLDHLEDFRVVNDGQKHFYDCGENFEYIQCQICDAKIDPNEWGDLMGEAYKTKFEELSFSTTCCGNKSSLNKLKYSWEQGFAKFAIQSESQKLCDEEIMKQMESILGKKTKLIITRY